MNLGKSRNNHHSNSINIVILNKVESPSTQNEYTQILHSRSE